MLLQPNLSNILPVDQTAGVCIQHEEIFCQEGTHQPFFFSNHWGVLPTQPREFLNLVCSVGSVGFFVGDRFRRVRVVGRAASIGDS